MIPLRLLANVGAQLLKKTSELVTSRYGSATTYYGRKVNERPQEPTFRAYDYLKELRRTQNLSLADKLALSFEAFNSTKNVSGLPSLDNTRPYESGGGLMDFYTKYENLTRLVTSRYGSATTTFGRQMYKRPQEPTFRAHDYLKEPRRTQNLSLADKLAQTFEAFNSTNDASGLPSSDNTGPYESGGDLIDFYTKYVETDFLGKGGFGKVNQGYRKSDNLPVAIKHTRLISSYHTTIKLQNKIILVPMEVALMLKVHKKGTTNACVKLLDWYEVLDRLIIVMERPVPCISLRDLIKSREGPLSEHETKIIIKQLVDAIIEIQSKGVFHRDIKPDNILLQNDSDGPRVRIIDFGCGTHLKPGQYTDGQVTLQYISPEIVMVGEYEAEPLTVWQLGVTMFWILHSHLPFQDLQEIVEKTLVMDKTLSTDCRNFLSSCLAKSIKERPTLHSLKNHPWLK